MDQRTIEEFGFFPAAVLDCVRNRIETCLGESRELPYWREKDGVAWVQMSARFIAGYLYSEHTKVVRALVKLIDAGVLNRDFLSGKQDGYWYSFTKEWVEENEDYFRTYIPEGIPRMVVGEAVQNAPGKVVQNAPGVVQNAPKTGGAKRTNTNNIPSGSTLYTDNSNAHAGAHEAAAVDLSFMTAEERGIYGEEVLELLPEFCELDVWAGVCWLHGELRRRYPKNMNRRRGNSYNDTEALKLQVEHSPAKIVAGFLIYCKEGSDVFSRHKMRQWFKNIGQGKPKGRGKYTPPAPQPAPGHPGHKETQRIAKSQQEPRAGKTQSVADLLSAAGIEKTWDSLQPSQ